MIYLDTLTDWLEEYKTKYKPFFICPPPKDLYNPEEYLSELQEINGINGQTCATLSITVGSLEEAGFLVGYLRGKPGVKILYDDERFSYPVDQFNPVYRMKTYDTPEDFYHDQEYNICLRGTEVYLEIEPDIFPKFWREFLEEFLIPCKYVLKSP